MKRRRLIHLVLLIAGMTMNYAFAQPMSISPVTDKNVLRRDMERVLSEEWDLWYPRSIDSADGGFFSDLNYRWEVVGEQDKMIVTQARHVWATANAAMFYQEDNTFRSIARHGVDFLRDRMWDREFGGFYDLVSKEGTPRTEHGHIVKRAYGNAFAIYGLAAYFHASGDTASLNLAQETFRWLEKHSYDPRHGGYFQFMNQDGTPFTEGYENIAPKDQNSTIHLLEALTELYRVWPDPVVKERLTALLHIVRDTITTQHGYMALFFRRDWTPISFRDSSQAAREGNYALDHVR